MCVSSLIMSHCLQSTGLVPLDSALSSHFSQLKNLRTLSPLNKESGKLEGKVSKCRFCCLLQISAPHLVFFWAPCIGGQTNYGGAISGHTFPTSRLSGRTPSPSSAPIAFLELVKDEEWPQWAYEGNTRPKQTFEAPRLKAVLRWVPIQPGVAVWNIKTSIELYL